MPTVRMPAVRCDIGAKKVRQQCECQQCESHFFSFFFSFLLIEKFNNRVLRLPKKCSLIINITGECKHCGASLRRHDPFSSMETKSCLFEEMSPISGYLPNNAR